MAEPNSWILEAEPATFQQDVVERSRTLTIVVDFYAEWCQPCKALGPVLEKLAKEFDGKFLLAKVDTEKLPEIAAGFGVQSIPAVYALRNGEIIDFFVGALPEPQLRSWLARILPSEAEEFVAAAGALADTDSTAAEAKYRQAIALDANLATAKIGLANLLLKLNKIDDSREQIDELERRGYLEPEAERVKAALELRAHGKEAGNVDALRAAVAADPKNLDQKLKLAEALAAVAQYEEALQTALSLIQTDRKRFGEPARKLMVDVFQILPGDSELVSTYRRQLSMALY